MNNRGGRNGERVMMGEDLFSNGTFFGLLGVWAYVFRSDYVNIE